MPKRSFLFIQKHAAELLIVAIVIMGTAVAVAPSLMGSLKGGGFAAPSVESTQALATIRQNFQQSETSLIVVFKAKDGSDITAPQNFAATQTVLAELANDASVQEASFQKVAQNNKSAFATASLKGGRVEQEAAAVRLRANLQNERLRLEFGGQVLLNYDVTAQVSSDLHQAEIISFSLLAVLLVIVFRGFVAALVPLLLGGFTVLGAMMVLRGMAELTTIVEYALNVIILIGLGLAVDYSLLIVSRFREELAASGNDKAKALAVTMRTAGRTVFFSGLTVIISLASLLVFPLDFLKSMGWGGSAAVGVAMLSALLVLPALLYVLGPGINWLSFGSAKRLQRATAAGKKIDEAKSIWYKTGAFFMRRAVITMVVVFGLLLAAGIPFLHAALATPNHKVLPASSEARQVTEQLRQDFGFTAEPIYAVYTAAQPFVGHPDAVGHAYDYIATIKNLPGVTGVESFVGASGLVSKEDYQALFTNPSAAQLVGSSLAPIMKDNTTLLAVSYNGESVSAEAQNLVRDIRAVPSGDAQVQLAGDTAELVDLLAVLQAHIPYAAVIIASALFILLFLMLGSVIIPLKAMVQNVLSLGVSFGALVWIFQDDGLKSLGFFNATGTIDATQPVLIFAVAFGLSMDYSVFLYSRIKEEYDKTGDNRQAVLSGLQKTGSIITSAAMLLCVVVVAFATSKIAIMQQIGVGLGLAIIVDAFVVRMLLVPATMQVLGRFNWWAPKFMRGLHARFAIRES